MVFTVIEPTAGLSPTELRRARRAGPSAVTVRTSYRSLLATAGFVDIEVDDRTKEYRATQLAWIDATVRRADEFRRVAGAEMYDERVADRFAALAAIDDGLLRRRIYTSTRRPSSMSPRHPMG